MFGLFAAINSLSNLREGREALHYENYIRTGQGIPSTKIYRESSSERRSRKELAVVRARQRFEQQLKIVRLMKKLLVQADQQTANGHIDEDLEQMRIKVTQLEVKLRNLARAKNLPCEDKLDVEKPDDADDLELEQLVRKACNKENTPSPTNEQPQDDRTGVLSSEKKMDQLHDRGDHNLIERKRSEKDEE